MKVERLMVWSALIQLAACSFGDDDQPCTEFEKSWSDFINWQFARPVPRALQRIASGSDDVPDVDPLYDTPPIDVDNGVAETATVEIPDDFYILNVGRPFRVGTEAPLSVVARQRMWEISEFSGVIRDDIDGDTDDSDVIQILKELVDGRGGSNFDCDLEPGIDGVEVVGLTPTTYTVTLEDNGVYDTLTFAGPGTALGLSDLDQPADLTDRTSAVSLVDLGQETVIADPAFQADRDVLAWIQAARDPENPAFELVSEQEDSIALWIDNPTTETRDLVLLFDSSGALDFSDL